MRAACGKPMRRIGTLGFNPLTSFPFLSLLALLVRPPALAITAENRTNSAWKLIASDIPYGGKGFSPILPTDSIHNCWEPIPSSALIRLRE